jgi:outer membrane protein OmpA-like peptidoglycan-associated protein
MRTYPLPAGSETTGLRILGCLILLLSCGTPAVAQQRKYFVELGAAGGYQSFGDPTDLGGAAGGVGRLGLWLPLNFSAEVEGAFTSPHTKAADVGVSVKNLTASLLYNVLLGSSSSLYLKLGGGTTRYGSDCPTTSSGPLEPICGSSGALAAGLGFRAALTPALLIRTEGTVTRNKSEPTGLPKVNFSNVGINLGLSYMLGSKPVPDSDGDGILNNRDRCPDTPAGAQVDGRGCSRDSDGDGVQDGVDRCANTVAGATVDASGCTHDTDGDNIPDGLDRCPATPSGVLVDPRGCPKDSDGDAIPDGLDRCSDTPRGATVDALGCPGDEDGDGVLDGLDQCPRSPAGVTVNTAGCAPSQAPEKAAPSNPSAAPAPARPPVRAPAQVQGQPPAQPPIQRQPRAAPNRGGALVAGVLPGVGFDGGTARLQASSYQALDSVATILLADKSLRVEIGAHTDSRSGSPAENLRLTALQAEAVRDYLVVKGIPYQQLLARGYGASVPLTPDTTPRGVAANRRVEIKLIPPGP